MGEVGDREGARESVEVPCFKVETLLSDMYVACIEGFIIRDEELVRLSTILEKEGTAVLGIDEPVEPCRLAQAYLYALETMKERSIRRLPLAMLLYVKSLKQVSNVIAILKQSKIRSVCIVSTDEEACFNAFRVIIDNIIDKNRKYVNKIIITSCSKKELVRMAKNHLNIIS
ncbi:MAG: hypothetical protein LRS46_03920 [Desulfurococcales archaeon]|nr:hypothetical protein [Desulfurococcales archaeon]